MSCNNKTKYTCGDSKTYATCTLYEKELPEFTKIEDECYTIEETTEDQYILIGEIKDEIDLSELGESCLDYLLDENDKIVVKNVLLKYEEKFCEYEERITALESTAFCDMSISDCDFDMGTLVDDCDNPPTTWKELVQILINQHNT